MKLTDKDIERFKAKVAAPNENGCHLWLGGKFHFGHGQFHVGGTSIPAHRVAYMLAKGDPGHLCVCHSCDRPSCVNPEHLWLGTRTDNAADRDLKGRTGRGLKDKSRHARGERVSRARLTAEKVLEIRALREAGHELMSIASRFGVGGAAISKIVKRQVWKHV